MLVRILEDNITFILILVTFASILGVFLFKNFYKKIACLTSGYSSIILLFFTISLQDPNNTDILSLITSFLVVFSATIATGIAIINKITEKKKN